MYKGEKVNVIMPVYNEEKTVSEIIDRVLAQKYVDRIIIVNDCSKDDSERLIKSAIKKSKKIEYHKNSKNIGKGFSVITGFNRVKRGIVIIQDADLEYYPEDYVKLLNALEKDTVVYGTRMRDKVPGHHYSLARFANALITFEFNLLYNEDISDINTCYKVFKKEMLNGVKLSQNGFLIEPEISVDLVKKGYKIKEVNIRYHGRTYKDGKKIRARDGIMQMLYLFKRRFSS